MNIYILRHGEKKGDEQGLTNLGKRQIKLLTKRLSKLNITKIYSSDLTRCKETSEIISKEIKVPIIYNPSLREVPSAVKENSEMYKKEIDIIKGFFDNINDTTKDDENILISSSGIVIRILLSLFLNINPKNANFMQYPSGLTKVEKINGRFRVWFINDTSHLPDKIRVTQN